jgi:hypothetical protein
MTHVNAGSVRDVAITLFRWEKEIPVTCSAALPGNLVFRGVGAPEQRCTHDRKVEDETWFGHRIDAGGTDHGSLPDPSGMQHRRERARLTDSPSRVPL